MIHKDILSSIISSTITLIASELPIPLALQESIKEVGLHEVFKEYYEVLE